MLWALLHSTITLMSVKGQSHISFLPWRINNVVILAETGTSESWAGSTLFSNLSSPKGPSSLVLFDSFIMNALQSCCPGQPQKSSMENNIINTVSFTGSCVLFPKQQLHFISIAHSMACGLDLICGVIMFSVSWGISSVSYE